jgi:Flp pilus assembly protein TadD
MLPVVGRLDQGTNSVPGEVWINQMTGPAVFRQLFRGAGLILFLTLVGMFELPAGSQENPQANAPLRSAQSALERGDPAQAVRILSEYLQKHPDDSRARTLLGQAYAMAGQFEEAEQELATVLKAEPTNYVALTALGEIYDQEGQPQKAEPLLARAVKASQGNPQIQMEWATILARLHEYQKAQTALNGVAPPVGREQQISFHRLKASVALGLGNAAGAAAEMETALALQPDDSRLILATAAAQLQAENWKRATELANSVFTKTHEPTAGLILLEAQLAAKTSYRTTLESLRTAARRSPEELELRQRLAELLVSNGKFAESIEDFQRAVELKPNRPDLFFNLALAQFKAAHLDDALASAEKNRGLSDSADVEDLLGDIEEARGDSLAAVKSYQSAVALAPDEEKYRLSLALEFLRHKSFDPAKMVLEQAGEAHPNSWKIPFTLGMLQYFEGKEEDATPTLLHAAKLAPQPPVVLKYVGDIQMDRAAGPDASAVSQLCKYAEENPKDATMQYYCAALLFRRDYAAENKANMPDILRRINAAATHLPNDPSPHCQLGRAYRWLEQWQAALRESEICVRLDPDSAQAHYRLAQIYHHEGNEVRAKQEMTLYEADSKHVVDENARRDETMKTFLYTIQGEAPDHK